MKHTFKKTLSLLLCILLLAPSVLTVFAFAETPAVIAVAYAGQKSIPVLEITSPTLPEGIISDMEYGYNEPLMKLTSSDFWAEDLTGNAVTTGLPNYIELYTAQNGDALYLAIVVNENAKHTNNLYSVDTFLGFGDSTVKGATTTFVTQDTKYSRGPVCVETLVTELSANGGERLYSVSPAYEYPLPGWAQIHPQADGTYNYVFEAELNLKDAVKASGENWDGTPGAGYFSFDLGLYSGTTRTGTLHFTTKEDKVPHVLNLAGGSADLVSLEVENGGDLTPAFDPSVSEYTVIVTPGSLPEVKAEASDDGATIEVIGLDEANVNVDHSIQVKVTPANGAPGKIYTLKIVRNFDYKKFNATGRTFATVLEEIAATEWGAADAVEITLDGSVEDSSELLLGLPTIFKSNGTRLPIIIDGNGNSVIDLKAEKIASANDITFKNVHIPMEEKNIEIYAGSGNLVFEDVDFGVEIGGKSNAKFFGDTYTEAVFAGWTQKEWKTLTNAENKLQTSITFKGTTSYAPSETANTLIGAVGFNGDVLEDEEVSPLYLDPCVLSASFILDGGTVNLAGARVGTSPVSRATVEMRSGKALGIAGDGMTYASDAVETYSGETYVIVSGGEVGKAGVSGVTSAVAKGNLYIEISEQDAENAPTVISKVTVSNRAEIKASPFLKILGGTVLGDVKGASANLASYNTIEGGVIEGNFYGVGDGSAKRVVNTLSGGTIKGNFYGGSYGATNVRAVENKLSDCIIEGNYVGANRSGTLYGDVTNAITNSTVNGSFIGGNENGTVTGKIINRLIGSTVGGEYVGAMPQGTVGSSVTNSFSGAEIGADLYAANKVGGVKKTITNDFADTKVAGILVGGNGEGSSLSISNKISGVSSVAGVTTMGNVVGSVGGSITNEISGGTFTGIFYAGNGEGDSESITNTIANATFSNVSVMGHKSGDVNGDITNTLTDSKFGKSQAAFDYSGASAAGVVYGDVTNTVVGACTFGGYFGGTAAVGAVDATTGEITTPTCDIEGQITNNLKENASGKAPYFANRSSYGVGYFGGSRSGKVGGGIVNNVDNMETYSRFYGGSFGSALKLDADEFSIGLNEYGASVTNIIKNGTFNAASGYYHSAGPLSADIQGDVVTTIDGGTFGVPFAFGARTTVHPEGFTGKYVGVINGGTFGGNVYGGNHGHNASQKADYASASIDLTINGGTFNGNVYGGGAGANPINGSANLSIYAGTFNGDVHPGSETKTDNSAKMTVKCKKPQTLYFYGNVGSRNVETEAAELIATRNKCNILLGENAALTFTYIYTLYLNRISGLFTEENPNPSTVEYQVFEPITTWTDGVAHVSYYHPEKVADDPETEAREDVSFVSFVSMAGDPNNLTRTTTVLETPVGDMTNLTVWAGRSTAGTLVQDLSAYPTVPANATIEDHGLTLDASKLTQAKLDAIPVATGSMTAAQRRQVALDYFALQQSFSWTPNKTLLNYPTSNVSEGVHDSWMNKTLDVGKIYGSIPYQSLGTGNLYRWLEYYDENTGIFYLTDAIHENGGFAIGDENTDVHLNKEYEDVKHPGLKYFFNQCSVASFWGWARVVNSALFAWTADMTVRNGFIPVGLYTYGYTDYNGVWRDMTTISRFGEITESNPGYNAPAEGATTGSKPYDTKHVIADYNASHTSKYGYAKAWYDIYAQMEPADCLVSTGHAMMVASVDPEAQTVRVCEQIEGWGISEADGYTLSGVPYIRQGQAYKEYTFAQLMSSNYIAFTFAEFQDPNDPADAAYLDFYNNTILTSTSNIVPRYSRTAEKFGTDGINAMCGADVEETKVFMFYDANKDGTIQASETEFDRNSTSLSYGTLRYTVLTSNQTISDMFITITDPNGRSVEQKIWRPGTASIRQVYFNKDEDVKNAVLYSGMADFNNGKNTITIKVQLGTGELVTVYSGLFK